MIAYNKCVYLMCFISLFCHSKKTDLVTEIHTTNIAYCRTSAAKFLTHFYWALQDKNVATINSSQIFTLENEKRTYFEFPLVEILEPLQRNNFTETVEKGTCLLDNTTTKHPLSHQAATAPWSIIKLINISLQYHRLGVWLSGSAKGLDLQKLHSVCKTHFDCGWPI